MPKGRPFWTAYRKFLVRTLLAREESRPRIAGKLGVTTRQLGVAIWRYDLTPRPLLEAIAERGGDPGHMNGEVSHG
jgi:hypothetical protein